MADITSTGITQDYRNKVLLKAQDSLNRLKNDITIHPQTKANVGIFVNEFALQAEKAISEGRADKFLSIFQKFDSDLSGDIDPTEQKKQGLKNEDVLEKKCFGKNLDNIDVIEMAFGVDSGTYLLDTDIPGKVAYDLMNE